MTAHLVSPRVFAFSKRSGAGEGEEVSRWRTGELEAEGESGGEQQPHFLGRSAIGSPEHTQKGAGWAEEHREARLKAQSSSQPSPQEPGELAQGSQRLGEGKA